VTGNEAIRAEVSGAVSALPEAAGTDGGHLQGMQHAASGGGGGGGHEGGRMRVYVPMMDLCAECMGSYHVDSDNIVSVVGPNGPEILCNVLAVCLCHDCAARILAAISIEQFGGRSER